MFYHIKQKSTYFSSYVKYQSHFVFLKNYNKKNEDYKKIVEKSGYYFMNMTNINNFDPKLLLINEISVFNSGSTMYEISYCEESNTPYIVFNNIEIIFRKSGQNKYLVFCETDKNKKILKNYTKIIGELKDQILFITEENSFVMGKDFKRVKFKTSDDLPFNKKIIFQCV